MSALNELDVLRDVCARLERANIDYMLTGSLAMNYYAQPRMTRDIDLVVALETGDERQIADLFTPDFYVDEQAVAQALQDASMFNLMHLDSVVKVDVIVRKDTVYRHAEFERRQRIELEGFEVWIASREDLVLSKLVWAKPSRSEMQLRDVRNLLSGDIDMGYLQQWAPELGVKSLLEECLES